MKAIAYNFSIAEYCDSLEVQLGYDRDMYVAKLTEARRALIDRMHSAEGLSLHEYRRQECKMLNIKASIAELNELPMVKQYFAFERKYRLNLADKKNFGWQ